MRKDKYTLIIDGKEIKTGNHIKPLKEEAEFWFTYVNAYFAKIMVGNRVYSAKFHYSSRWS